MKLNKSLTEVIRLNIEDKPKFYFAVENFPNELKEYFFDEIREEVLNNDDSFEDKEPLDWNDLD